MLETKEILFAGLAGAALVGLAVAANIGQVNANPIDASFQLEDFCSATSVEDFNLSDGVDHGVFFTAAHCVADQPIGHIFTVKNLTGSHKVQLMAYDKERDIAYLRTLNEVPEGLARLPLHLGGLETGDRVTLYGYPFGLTSKAIVEGIVGEDFQNATYTIASVAGGFSGGTLVDQYGGFAGILIAMLSGPYESHSGFSLSVTPEDIQSFIDAQLELNIPK
jgi:S1-C subfamily serine protease